MTEKPLHVRVAEKLGYTHCFEDGWHPPGISCHRSDERCLMAGFGPPNGLPRYDTDWSATGPLIERFGINIERAQAARPDGSPYKAWRWATLPEKAWADTPLEAVCNLILALPDEVVKG